MIKNFCDRCGKEIPDMELRIIGSKHIYKIINYKYNYSHQIQLCKNCHNKIMRFIENKEQLDECVKEGEINGQQVQ